MPSATASSNTTSLSKSPYSEMDSSMTYVQPTSVSHDSVPTSEDIQFEAPDAADMQSHVVTQEEQRPAPVPRSHPAANVHMKYPAPPSYYAPQPRKTKHHYSPASLPHVISNDPSFEIPSLENKESEDSVYSYKNYEASHSEHMYAISSKASFDKMESASKRKEAPDSEASEQKEKKAKSSHPQYHYGHYPHYPYYYHYYPPPHASAAAAHASAAASASAAVASSGHAYAWPYPHHAYPYAYPGYYSHHPTSKPSKGKKSGSHPASGKTVAKKRPEVKKRKAENVTVTKKEAKPAVAVAKIQFPPRDITINDNEDKKETLSSGARERRARKNAQSRMRAAKLKDTIAMIKQKRPEERTAEEAAKLATFEERRLKKNHRSRQRALERKTRVLQITRKSEEEWTKEEKEFMHETLVAKYKKNEGDRLRRKRMRESGMSVADTSYSGSTSLDDYPDSDFKPPSHFKFQPVDISSSQQNGAQGQAPLTPKSPHFYDIEHDDFTPNMFEMTPKQSSQEKDFMSNFVFPSPSKDEERFLSSPTLELCADTSILDQSLEEIAYSPRNSQPYASASREHEMTSPLNIHPLDLPRRTKPISDTIYDIGQDWRGDDDFARQEAIAVSFSMDEPLELA